MRVRVSVSEEESASEGEWGRGGVRVRGEVHGYYDFCMLSIFQSSV